jgi:hypothetical protein
MWCRVSGSAGETQIRRPRVSVDPHVHAVALPLLRVEGLIALAGHADSVDAQQGAVEDDEGLSKCTK